MKDIICTILGVVIGLVISWIVTCGIFALLCWLLSLIGFTTIFGWTIHFSWIGGTAFWLLYNILKTIFKRD